MKELKTRKATLLHAKLVGVNTQKRLVHPEASDGGDGAIVDPHHPQSSKQWFSSKSHFSLQSSVLSTNR